jgi:hypothetical protein
MSDEKNPLTPAADPVAPAPEAAADKPAFKSDDFLAGKPPPASVKATPPVKPDRPIKRGGVSFFTALAMSTLATAGGAYLALFIQARPDVLQRVGIGQFLPVTPVSTPNASGVDAALAQRVKTLETDLVALSVRVSAFEPKPVGGVAAPLPSPPAPIPSEGPAPSTPPSTTPTLPPANTNIADIGLLKSELAGIGGRVTAIETRLAALDPTGAGGAVVAGLQAEMAALKATISALQQQVATAPSPAVTMAVVNLADAAGRSGPFLAEFETLRAAMGNGPEIASLEALARTGVPTRAMLQDRFATLGPAITAAATATKKEGGLVVWIRSFFSDMVKVTPAPNASGNANDDILGRAKLKLDQGDLSGSVDDLATLPSPPTAVSEWIASARKRIELEGRLSAVRGIASRPAPVPTAQPAAQPVGALPSVIAPAPSTTPSAPASQAQGKTP